jgi:hypothetical protein
VQVRSRGEESARCHLESGGRWVAVVSDNCLLSSIMHVIFQALFQVVHICHLLGPLTLQRTETGHPYRELKEGIGETPRKTKIHLSKQCAE